MHIPVRLRRTLPSLAVGATAVAGSFVAVGFTDAFVGGALAEFALAVSPPIVFVLGLEWLGSYARPLLLATAIAGAIVVFAVAAAVGERAADAVADAVGKRDANAVESQSAGERDWSVHSFAVFLSIAGVGALATGSIASALGAAIAGTLAFAVADTDVAGSTSPVRRRLLRSTGVLLGTVGLGGLLATRRDGESATETLGGAGAGLDDEVIDQLLDAAADRSFELPATESLVSERFYRVDINVTGFPDADPDDWSLRIHGAVDRETEFDFESLIDHPTEHRFGTLRCVGDERNGRLIDTALWTGTPLAPLLDAAGAGRNCCVRLEAADGYYQAFPREALERGFLAWGMNGEPLPARHGAPVRVLIPGHWGEINVKWIDDIEIRDEPATGYWEERGWHGTGPVKTVAKVHTRRRDGDRVLIGGPAYGGTRGISDVEVSVDDGESWESADLTEPLPGSTPIGGTVDSGSRDADAWRLWRYEYEKADRHEAIVRAYERDGTRQPDERTDAHPRGASGWVHRPVHPSEE